MTLVEQIFAGLVVTWVTGLTAVLWRLAGLPGRVVRLEDAVVEFMQKGELLAGLAATVEGESERADRAEKRNVDEHGAIRGLLETLTKHVLEIKQGNGRAVRAK